MMAINLLIYVGIGLATLGMAVLGNLQRRRIDRYTLQDTADTMERIADVLANLRCLSAKERVTKRRMVARAILRDLVFVFSLVDECRHDNHPDVRERTWKLAREIVQLRWELQKCLLLSCFRPNMVADCQRIFHAACRHCRVWLAYGRLMQARYRNSYGDQSVLSDS